MSRCLTESDQVSLCVCLVRDEYICDHLRRGKLVRNCAGEHGESVYDHQHVLVAGVVLKGGSKQVQCDDQEKFKAREKKKYSL